MRLVYHITSQKYHNQDSSNLTEFPEDPVEASRENPIIIDISDFGD